MALTPVSRIVAAVRQARARALREAAEQVGEAADRNAPKDTRVLVDSRRIEVDAQAGRAEISYGKGLSDPRAVINHEKTDIHHDTGGPKYLERAMATELPKVRQKLASEIGKELR